MSDFSVNVECHAAPAGGWNCDVDVRRDGVRVTDHRVHVSNADLGRLDPAATEPEPLVAASFAFLLEREPPTSILRSFDLPVIASYFPGFDEEIRGRRSAGRAE